MLLSKSLEKIALRSHLKPHHFSTTPQQIQQDEFKPLNLKHVKGQITQRKPLPKPEVLPPRTKQMAVDQDWGSVWPGPRTFHPATVPLPVRQGFVEKGAAPPDKWGNAELMKIPNFLHLTPPVIKRQCEALKKFCTPWPKSLSDEKCEKYFPFEISSSDYCHSSPTIRDPLARIVSIKFKLGALQLDGRSRDKFLRLVGDRYNKESDTVTIVTDRCPLKTQNYDYAIYLVTALYYESRKIEPWESEKTEADMEVYIWENNSSKKSVEGIFQKSASEIPNINGYVEAVSNLMNEGENAYSVDKYGEAVRKLLNVEKKL